jgi:hypothetical protein
MSTLLATVPTAFQYVGFMAATTASPRPRPSRNIGGSSAPFVTLKQGNPGRIGRAAAAE